MSSSTRSFAQIYDINPRFHFKLPKSTFTPPSPRLSTLPITHSYAKQESRSNRPNSPQNQQIPPLRQPPRPKPQPPLLCRNFQKCPDNSEILHQDRRLQCFPDPYVNWLKAQENKLEEERRCKETGAYVEEEGYFGRYCWAREIRVQEEVWEEEGC